VADEEFVKGAQGREAEGNGGAAEVLAAEKAQVAAEIIALEIRPRGRRFSLLGKPGVKPGQRLRVVPLGVGGSTTIRRQVGEEFINPLVRL
jgi:hypothetical protein